MQVATCLTSYTDEYGKTWIIGFNEVIWFRVIIDHSLINPNQIHMVGIPISDYLFDENRKLSISYEKLFIPFSIDGNYR